MSVLPGSARAQDYPSQDIRLICGFPPGSGADVFVRYFAEKLRPVAGRTVVVENKVGAASNIATEYVARSKPDGHTLYPFAGTTVAASMHLFKNPPVDVGKAIRVAATTSNLAFMLVVDAKSPYKTVAELTAAMKQKGSRASYAVAANPGRIMGAIYKDKAGLEALEVQYRTAADSLNEMPSGKLDYGLHDPIFALAQQREGRLRVLAISASKRLQSQPDLPTMTESGVPMDLDLWWGVMVPTATPKPIIDKINALVRADRAHRGNQEIPQRLWSRPLDQYPGAGPGDVRDRDQGMGRIRPDGQDRAAIRDASSEWRIANREGAANCDGARGLASIRCSLFAQTCWR